MNFLLSIGFGAGAAAWAYSKLGQRLGYGNSQNVWTMVGVIFVISTLVFYTILTYIIDL